MSELLYKLAELGALQLALLAVIAALYVALRAIQRRRSLRPPSSQSLNPSLIPEPDTPVRRSSARCRVCRKPDDGSEGWVRAEGTRVCPDCLIKHYD